MPHIFKNIRRKLVEQKKVAEYLRYAVGEIILVVIGILIALQVNNWNENRISHNESREALLSLRGDFQDNTAQIKSTAYLVNRMTTYTNKLIEVIDRDSLTVNPDSLGIFLTVGASSWWRLKTVSSTYDALSGAGKLDLIQNKKLRKLLAEFYATTKSGFEDENNSETLAIKIAEITSHETYILWPITLEKYYKVNITEKSPFLKRQAVHSVVKEDNLMGLLILKLGLNQNQERYLNNLLSLSNEILNEINRELKVNP